MRRVLLIVLAVTVLLMVSMRREPQISPEHRLTLRAQPVIFRDGTPAGNLSPGFMRHLAFTGIAGDASTPVASTLDADVTTIVRDILNGMAQRDAVIIVMDNGTAEILAWEEKPRHGVAAKTTAYNGAPRHALALVAPLVSALAFENGWTPAKLLALPDTAPDDTSGVVLKPLLARDLLKGDPSRMIREAQTVAGDERVKDALRSAGMDVPGRGGFSPSDLIGLTELFSALARGGVWTPAVAVFGNRHDTAAKRLTRAESVAQVMHVLAEPATAEGTAMAVHVAAVPAGLFAFAATPRLTLGLWTSASDITAGEIPRLIKPLIDKELPSRSVADLSTLQAVTVCSLSGEKAGEACPAVYTELFPLYAVPTGVCSIHQRVFVDQRNGLLATPRCEMRHLKESVVEFFPGAFRKWAQNNRRGFSGYSPLCPATPKDAQLAIVSPRNGDIVSYNPKIRSLPQTVPFRLEAGDVGKEVTWYVNDELFTVSKFPHAVKFPITPGRYKITLATDGETSAPVVFSVRLPEKYENATPPEDTVQRMRSLNIGASEI